MRDDRGRRHLVVPVEIERAVLDHPEQQRRDVARVELRGARRHRRRQVLGRDHGDAVGGDDRLAGLRDLDVATERACRHVDDHRARPH